MFNLANVNSAVFGTDGTDTLVLEGTSFGPSDAGLSPPAHLVPNTSITAAHEIRVGGELCVVQTSLDWTHRRVQCKVLLCCVPSATSSPLFAFRFQGDKAVDCL